MPSPKTYRLDPAWIARRNRRIRKRVLVESAVSVGLIALAMIFTEPLFGTAAVLVAGVIVGEIYLMTKNSKWDSAARIEALDAGLQFHTLVREPVMLDWKDLRSHRQEANDSGISAVILTPESGAEDIRVEGYENLGELHECIAHHLRRDE
jgi:hypothetical protein